MGDDHDASIVIGLKDPWQFLFVDMDVAFMAGGVFAVMLTADAPPLVSVVCGGLVGYGLHVLRKGRPRGFGRHLRYWFFPPKVGPLRRTPHGLAHLTVA